MKKLLITLIVLIILTIITAFVSKTITNFKVVSILTLAVLKFVGVAFYFMEVRKAHIFWKTSIVVFLIVFATLIML